jgi:hypothetical protein
MIRLYARFLKGSKARGQKPNKRGKNGVQLTFANTSSGKLTIKISTAKRKDRRNILDIPLCPR